MAIQCLHSQPQLHLLPVDVCDAQPHGAAVQLAGVLGVITMQSGITLIFIDITVSKSRQRYPSPAQNIALRIARL